LTQIPYRDTLKYAQLLATFTKKHSRCARTKKGEFCAACYENVKGR